MRIDNADCAALSKRRIEDINAHIKGTISPSLYLAAYYAPKQYPLSGSNDGLFWCAVTNTYGLFRDCMPRLYGNDNSLIDVFVRNGILADEVAEEIRSIVILVDALRSVYAHNANPTVASNAKAKIRITFGYFKETVPDYDFDDTDDEDVFIIPSFSANEWFCCFESICNCIGNCLDSLDAIIPAIGHDSRKTEITNDWVGIMAEWVNSKFLFSAVKNKLAGQDRFIRNGMGPSNAFVKNEVDELKKRIIEQEGVDLNKERNETEERYTSRCLRMASSRVIHSMKTPALPYDVISMLYDTYHA